MKLIASGTGRCHAPELTRIAFISAFVAGAEGFRRHSGLRPTNGSSFLKMKRLIGSRAQLAQYPS